MRSEETAMKSEMGLDIVQSALYRKLHALQVLSIYVGLSKHGRNYLYGNGRNRPLGSTAELFILIATIRNENLHPVSRAAAAFLLEIYAPGWRSKLPELAGIVADRNDCEVAHWREQILERDKVCQQCGTSKNLEAHHIVQWALSPELRLVVSNGEALCESCHKFEPVFRS